MILAGVDEAGYGPLLGPLVVGCCAFRVESLPEEDIPCIWTRLRKILSKKRSTSGKKLHVNDSKLVYSPSNGLKELERSVLCLVSAVGSWSDDLETFVARVAPHVAGELPQYAWYRPATAEKFPLDQDAISVKMFANALRAEMDRNHTHCVYLAARVLLERQLNGMLAQTRNKSSVLFSTSAIHLDHLIRTFGHENLTIVCDQQGGRAHYGSLLRLMFDEWALEVTREGDGIAEYRLKRNENIVRIIFREKAETVCMSVAVASMLSKYLREALMRRFNAFWATHLPAIAPTAGYYTDGMRFLKDTETKRRELGISDQEFIRSR